VKHLSSLLVLFILILSPAVSRSGDTVVQHDRVRLDSVQADFSQEKHLKILVRPLISTGRFVFQAPGSLRWEYSTPLRSVLIMHDGRIKKYVEVNGDLVEERGLRLDAMQVVLGEISGWLEGRFTENASFDVSYRDEHTVVLTPKKEGMRTFIQSIELGLADQAGLLNSVTIFEGPDSFTRLLFAKSVLNQPVADSLFTKP
jgi:outer membrane lipoprotein-sorting protein